MPRICSVVFRGGGKVFDFNAGRLDLAPGDGVVVDTARGADYGRVVRGPGEVGEEDAPRGLRKVLRKATPADLETIASHREIEVEAKREGRRLARELGLDVKIVEARQAFDDMRLGITFYAEERTDTREPALELAGVGASSSNRSAPATNRASSAATDPAAAASVAPRSPATRTPSPSAWPRTRTCRSIPPRSQAAAAG